MIDPIMLKPKSICLKQKEFLGLIYSHKPQETNPYRINSQGLENQGKMVITYKPSFQQVNLGIKFKNP